MKITKTIFTGILIIMMAITLTSCAEYDQNAIDETQNNVEQNFRNIMNKSAANDATGAYMKIFDQNGNKLYQLNGKKITVSSRIEDSKYEPYGYSYWNGKFYEYRTSYKKIYEKRSLIANIDGVENKIVNESAIIYDNSLVPDYELSENNLDNNDRNIDLSSEELKNKITKEKILIVKSNDGTPLFVFSGNSIQQDNDETIRSFVVDNNVLFLYNLNYLLLSKSALE